MALIDVVDLPADIRYHEMIGLMVAGVNARAARVAPCLTWTGTPVEEPAPSDDQLAEARLVLVGAVRRWVDAGTGAFQQQQAGIYSATIDTRQRTGYNLWPSEINALQDICASGTTGSASAFSIRPGGSCGAHMPWCSLAFGALYCSCGADLTDYQYPLYEGGVLTTGDEY